MLKANSQSRSIRGYVLAALGLLLAWQVLTRSFAAHLASEAPETALLLQTGEPVANANLADRMLNLRPGTEHSAGAPAGPKRDDDGAQQGGDRLAGWAEIALKAAAQKLPLDRTKGAARPAQTVALPSPLTAKESAEIRAYALTSLASEPLNARALRILGQLADAAGDEASAFKYMRAAASRSLAENIAIYWMMQKSFEKKDYAGAIYYSDVFLRKHPQFIEQTVPMLAKMAESTDQKAVGELKQMLAQNPPWRSTFFDNLPWQVTDARTPLNMLLSVRETPTPASFANLNSYFALLLRHKLYELAYYTWLQFLPTDELASIGYLANGDFERAPTGTPFDWGIAQGPGITVDIVPRPDATDQRALYIELGPGRVEFPGLTQMILLSPGTYRLTGKIKGELTGRRGLQWRVICVGANIPAIGEGPMFVGMAPVWADFELRFTVPEQECRAQQVRLDLAARSASEQLVSGSVWYDDLQVSRAPVAAKDAAATPAAAKEATVTPDVAKEATTAPAAAKEATTAPAAAKDAKTTPAALKDAATAPDAAQGPAAETPRIPPPPKAAPQSSGEAADAKKQ